MTALLEVEDLRVAFPTRHGPIEVVRGISFALGRERLGIVGESGSGKTMTGRSILGLVPPPGDVAARRLAFDGIDLRAAPPATWRALRGKRISMVMQDPKFSLNPVMPMRSGSAIPRSINCRMPVSTAERVLRRSAKPARLARSTAISSRRPWARPIWSGRLTLRTA